MAVGPEGGGVGKISTYSYFGGGSKPFLCNIFQVDILEIAGSSGLAGIIFHLRLEGKKVLG